MEQLGYLIVIAKQLGIYIHVYMYMYMYMYMYIIYMYIGVCVCVIMFVYNTYVYVCVYLAVSFKSLRLYSSWFEYHINCWLQRIINHLCLQYVFC